MTLLYREFPYPLNVFMHVLISEEGDVQNLHYGLFENAREPIAIAQERSTSLLLERLPPPCRLLEVGIGLGTTLARLVASGYDAEGITPDEPQIAAARARFGGELRVQAAALESFETASRYDAIVFQESSQYIDSEALFRKVRALSSPGACVIVLDEFAIQPVERPGALHRLDLFLAAAQRYAFRLEEDLDLSRQAAPTVDYFLERLPRYREALVSDLGIFREQVEALIESGRSYRDLYRSGAYSYRLLRFRA